MKLSIIFALAASTVLVSHAQQVGTYDPEVHPALPSQQCLASGQCKTEATKVVLDANWRWLHKVGDFKSCYSGTQWDATLCSDPVKCAENCALEGANYAGTYGITTSNQELRLQFVTKGQYGTNVGSRVYLLNPAGDRYKTFKLLNQEFAVDVDVSQVPCGLNGALYFVQMDADGGKGRFPTNKAGAAYGTGYCDAQCPHDIKFINGEANVLDWRPSGSDSNTGGGKYGTCCAEMDIWEANSMATAYTSHPCFNDVAQRCSNPVECGDGEHRFKGLCDKDGCDYNPFRLGNKFFYGPGSQYQIDTTKPFTVITQFITDTQKADGNLVEIRRLYKQNGKVIKNPSLNLKGLDASANSITDGMCRNTKGLFGDPNDHEGKGKLQRMGQSLKAGVVLSMSLWADYAANGLWLDSSYPTNKDPAIPGVMRGPCPTSGGKPQDLIAQYPGASVKFSNIRVGAIGSTTK